MNNETNRPDFLDPDQFDIMNKANDAEILSALRNMCRMNEGRALEQRIQKRAMHLRIRILQANKLRELQGR